MFPVCELGAAHARNVLPGMCFQCVCSGYTTRLSSHCRATRCEETRWPVRSLLLPESYESSCLYMLIGKGKGENHMQAQNAHALTQTCRHANIQRHTNMHVRAHTHTHPPTHTHTDTHTYTRTHTKIHTRTHACAHS